MSEVNGVVEVSAVHVPAARPLSVEQQLQARIVHAREEYEQCKDAVTQLAKEVMLPIIRRIAQVDRDEAQVIFSSDYFADEVLRRVFRREDGYSPERGPLRGF